MAEIGKIIVAGLTVAGAIGLAGVIETKLTVAGLAIQIPLLGSLSGILGSFLGALISGIAGAMILRQIDKFISNKLKKRKRKTANYPTR